MLNQYKINHIRFKKSTHNSTSHKKKSKQNNFKYWL